MREIHQFYFCPLFAFLYETKEQAELAFKISEMATGEYSYDGAAGEIRYFKSHSISASILQERTPLLLLEKAKNESMEDLIFTEFWKVIAGEKVGWIVSNDWLICPLESNKNA